MFRAYVALNCQFTSAVRDHYYLTIRDPCRSETGARFASRAQQDHLELSPGGGRRHHVPPHRRRHRRLRRRTLLPEEARGAVQGHAATSQVRPWQSVYLNKVFREENRLRHESQFCSRYQPGQHPFDDVVDDGGHGNIVRR